MVAFVLDDARMEAVDVADDRVAGGVEAAVTQPTVARNDRASQWRGQASA